MRLRLRINPTMFRSTHSLMLSIFSVMRCCSVHLAEKSLHSSRLGFLFLSCDNSAWNICFIMQQKKPDLYRQIFTIPNAVSTMQITVSLCLGEKTSELPIRLILPSQETSSVRCDFSLSTNYFVNMHLLTILKALYGGGLLWALFLKNQVFSKCVSIF